MAVNDDLFQAQVLHEHYIERFRNFEVKRMSALITDTRRELRRAIQDENLTKWNKSHYRSINRNLIKIQKAGNGRFTERLITDLNAFGASEAQYGVGLLTDKIPFHVNLKTPTPEQVWSAAMTNPLMMTNGTTIDLTQFLKGFTDKNLQIVEQGLRQGFLRGQTTDEIARNLAGATGTLSRRTADVIVRTSMNHMASMARRKVAETNNDIVKGYEWVSVLDKRTTPTCQDNDGRAWIYDDDERAKYDGRLLNGEQYPPAHMRCRSTTTYITRSWSELGIDGMDEVSPSTRASMNGQVAEKLTYKKWVDTLPLNQVQEIIGNTRFDMLLDGKLDIAEMYKPDGGLYTLKELQAKGYKVPTQFGGVSSAAVPPPPVPKTNVYGNLSDLDNATQNAWSRMSPAEQKALRRYTGAGSRRMNINALAGDASPELTSAIAKLPTLEGRAIRRYGVPGDKWIEMKDNFTAGKWTYWDNKAYSSTAITPRTGSGFARNMDGVEIIYHSQGKAKAGFAGRASSVSREVEYLIAPNQQYEVVNAFTIEENGINKLILEVTDGPVTNVDKLVFPNGAGTTLEDMKDIYRKWDEDTADFIKEYHSKGGME